MLPVDRIAPGLAFFAAAANSLSLPPPLPHPRSPIGVEKELEGEKTPVISSPSGTTRCPWQAGEQIRQVLAGSEGQFVRQRCRSHHLRINRDYLKFHVTQSQSHFWIVGALAEPLPIPWKQKPAPSLLQELQRTSQTGGGCIIVAAMMSIEHNLRTALNGCVLLCTQKVWGRDG